MKTNIIKITELTDCFDKNVIKSYSLGRTFGLSDLNYLKPFKHLIFLDFLPKPFIKIDKPDFFYVKTAIGMDRIEVTYKKNAPKVVQSLFEEQLRKMINFEVLEPSLCPQKAISLTKNSFQIDDEKCNGCLDCMTFEE